MGFCKCSLKTSSIVAAVFGFMESCFSIIGSAFIVSVYSPSNVQETIASVPAESVINPHFGFSVFQAIAISHLVFNAIWLVSTILLMVAITNGQVLLHRQWAYVTLIVTISDIILFIASITEITMGVTEFFNNIRLILLTVLVSRGFSFYVVNTYMAVYVYKRGSEILLDSQELPTQMQSIPGQPDPEMNHPDQQNGLLEQEMNLPYNPQYI